MITISRDFSIDMKNNKLYVKEAKSKVLAGTFDNRDRLIEAAAKRMLLLQLEGQTVGIEEYEKLYEDNKNIILDKIKATNDRRKQTPRDTDKLNKSSKRTIKEN